jgi:hypothetical protein
MVLVKKNEEAKVSALEAAEEGTAMDAYNDELIKAGVRLAAEGLYESAKGVRVHFDGKKKTFIDGPFTETKELIVGFWIWEVKSMDEAIEWIKRSPFQSGSVEIRPVHGPEVFANKA